MLISLIIMTSTHVITSYFAIQYIIIWKSIVELVKLVSLVPVPFEEKGCTMYEDVTMVPMESSSVNYSTCIN